MNHVEPIRDKEKIEEMKQVLLKSSYRDWFLFHIGINLGYRIGDLLQLKVKDIKNKTHIVVTEDKTNKHSRIKLRDGILQDIAEYVTDKEDEEYLFPSRKGDKPITRVQAYRILNNAAKEVGLEEIGCHTMRKTFGYQIYQMRKDVVIVQNLLNHSSPAITLRYIGVNQDILDEAVNELDI